MRSRREFLKAALAGSLACGSGCSRLGIAPGRGGGPRLRTITYNVYACYGWVPDEAKFKQRRDAARDKTVMVEMAGRFAEALRPFGADIITFQESPAEWVIAEIAGRLRMRHVFFPSGGNWPGAVFTPHEIVEAKNCPIVGGVRPKDLFTRHWGRAVLKTPLGELVLHSAHLHPSDDAVRAREVAEILKVMEKDFTAGRLFLFQGDLNHTPMRPEYARWLAAGLVDTFKTAGSGSEITMPRPTGEAPKRIDYVWAHGAMAQRAREVRVLNERPFCLDPNNPAAFALSDHLPVMATFEG